MKVIFWKDPSTFFSKLICWWTKQRYFHTELLFSDGQIFSASPNIKRTKFFTYNPLSSQPRDIFELNVSEEEEAVIRKFCEGELGCRYDFVGIVFSMVFPFQFQHPHWWFCSEVSLAALQKIGMFPGVKPHTVDPGEFFTKVITSGKVIQPKLEMKKYTPRSFEKAILGSK